MGRRDSADERWIEVKEKVRERDKGKCRMFKVISAKEAVLLKKKAGPLLQKIDSAHFRAVSELPGSCYDVSNVTSLNRWSHHCLDECRDPITGGSISRQERDLWWIRLLAANKKQFKELLGRNLFPLELLTLAVTEGLLRGELYELVLKEMEEEEYGEVS